MKGSNYALSIQSNPQSKWKLEFDRDHPTLRINYNFGQNQEYNSDIIQLKNCHKNDVPSLPILSPQNPYLKLTYLKLSNF